MNYNQTKQIQYKNLNVEIKYSHTLDHVMAYRQIIEQHRREMSSSTVQEVPQVPHKIFDKILNYLYLSQKGNTYQIKYKYYNDLIYKSNIYSPAARQYYVKNTLKTKIHAFQQLQQNMRVFEYEKDSLQTKMRSYQKGNIATFFKGDIKRMSEFQNQIEKDEQTIKKDHIQAHIKGLFKGALHNLQEGKLKDESYYLNIYTERSLFEKVLGKNERIDENMLENYVSNQTEKKYRIIFLQGSSLDRFSAFKNITFIDLSVNLCIFDHLDLQQTFPKLKYGFFDGTHIRKLTTNTKAIYISAIQCQIVNVDISNSPDLTFLLLDENPFLQTVDIRSNPLLFLLSAIGTKTCFKRNKQRGNLYFLMLDTYTDNEDYNMFLHQL